MGRRATSISHHLTSQKRELLNHKMVQLNLSAVVTWKPLVRLRACQLSFPCALWPPETGTRLKIPSVVRQGRSLSNETIPSIFLSQESFGLQSEEWKMKLKRWLQLSPLSCLIAGTASFWWRSCVMGRVSSEVFILTWVTGSGSANSTD